MTRPNRRRSLLSRRLRVVASATVAFATLSVAASTGQPDVVILENGDRVSGQIKGMSQGQLVLKTDHLGTLNIDWVHIRKVTGEERFEVELEDGSIHVGSIRPSEKEGMISVIDPDKTTDLGATDIVRIVPIEKRFWGRVDGTVNVGYSFTQSSDVSQVSLNADAVYRSRRHMTDLVLDSIITAQQVADTTSRHSLAGGHTRFLEHNWLTQADAGITQNQTMGINARVLLGGGGGRFLKRTNLTWFRLQGGLDVTREWPTGVAQPDTNLEANVSLDYSLFRYTVNHNDFRTRLTVYPSLTEWGRVRAEWTLRLQQSLVGNLAWGLNGYASYDSDPPDPTASTDDWGLLTTLGWTF